MRQTVTRHHPDYDHVTALLEAREDFVMKNGILRVPEGGVDKVWPWWSLRPRYEVQVFAVDAEGDPVVSGDDLVVEPKRRVIR